VFVPAVEKEGIVRLMAGMRAVRDGRGTETDVAPTHAWLDLSPGAEGGYEWIWLGGEVYALNRYPVEELEPVGPRPGKDQAKMADALAEEGIEAGIKATMKKLCRRANPRRRRL